MSSGASPQEVASAMISFASSFGLLKNSIIYVSTPITTGKNYLNWLKIIEEASIREEREPIPSRETFVKARNIESAQSLVERIRQQFPEPILDPTQLEDIRDWTQEDYKDFWIRVLNHFVFKVVMADGWEFSNGSVSEYVAALEKGLPVLAENLTPLTPEMAFERLTVANAEFQLLNQELSAISTALHLVRNYLDLRKIVETKND